MCYIVLPSTAGRPAGPASTLGGPGSGPTGVTAPLSKMASGMRGVLQRPLVHPGCSMLASRLQDAELAGTGQGLDPVAGAQLLQRPLEVGFDGIAGQPERGGDLGVRLAHRHPAQDVV